MGFCVEAESRVNQGSRSNYQQSLGSTNAWVNSDCSFHKISKRNNNTGIVLHFSLRGFRDRAERSEAHGKLTGKLCSERISHDPTTTGSGFGHQQCQLHQEKPNLSYHLHVKSLCVRRQKHS